MPSIGTLTAYVTADNTGLLRGARQSTMAVRSMTASMQRQTAIASAAFTRLGTVMTIGITAPLVLAGAKMVKLASDAEETANKFNVVFRNVRQESNKMATVLARDYGLSGLKSRQLLSDTGDLLTGFGFTGKSALDLSGKVNKLAVDLASFTNYSGGAEGASQALTKALLGERESVKQLGIAILEEDVKKRVAIMRGRGLTFETERQAKAYATLEIAMEQSKNAIGDFARSQNSVANQARIMKARLEDVAIRLGTAFLPIVNKSIGRVIKMLDVFMSLSPEIQTTVIHIAGLAAAVGPGFLILGKLLGVVNLLLGAIGGLATVVGVFLTPMGLLIAAVAAAIGIVLKLVGPVEVLAIVWEYTERVIRTAAENFKAYFDYMIAQARRLGIVSKVADIIGKAWIGLQTVFHLVLSGIGTLVSKLTGGLGKLTKALMVGMSVLGIEYPKGMADFAAALDGLTVKFKKFGDTQAALAVDSTKDWDNAWNSFAEGITGALEYAQTQSADKAAKIRSSIASIREEIAKLGGAVAVPGGGAFGGSTPQAGPTAEGPAKDPKIAKLEEWGLAERTRLEESALLWQKWLITQQETANNWGAMMAQTWVNMADGMATSFANMIVYGENLRDSLSSLFQSLSAAIIEQLAKQALMQLVFAKKMSIIRKADTADTIANEEVKVIAHGAGSAPHPWLIPAFVAMGLLAFSKALGGKGGKGSGGGGGVPSMNTSPSLSTGAESGGSGPTNITIVLEGGTRVMTPEERMAEAVTAVDNALQASGGSLGKTDVVVKDKY